MSKSQALQKMSRKEKEILHAKLRGELEQVLGAIWIATQHMSFEELALRAGLSVATVNRLYYGAYVRPQALTIQKLGYAVGYNLSFSKDGITVEVDEAVLNSL